VYHHHHYHHHHYHLHALPWLALPCLALPCLALPCLALPCLALAWLGLAWLGLAWLGLAWLGLAWLGLAWLGLAWLGLPIHPPNHLLTPEFLDSPLANIIAEFPTKFGEHLMNKSLQEALVCPFSGSVGAQKWVSYLAATPKPSSDPRFSGQPSS
jgi:hypothetical protein